MNGWKDFKTKDKTSVSQFADDNEAMQAVQSWLTHWHTQPAVRRSEPSMSFAFNSSLLSVDGMTRLLPFES